MLESKLSRQKVETVQVDNSVPYPEAPEVDHADLTQEHYRGARDPAKAPKRHSRESVPYRDR